MFSRSPFENHFVLRTSIFLMGNSRRFITVYSVGIRWNDLECPHSTIRFHTSLPDLHGESHHCERLIRWRQSYLIQKFHFFNIDLHQRQPSGRLRTLEQQGWLSWWSWFDVFLWNPWPIPFYSKLSLIRLLHATFCDSFTTWEDRAEQIGATDHPV